MILTKTNTTVYTILLTAILSASGWAGTTFYDDYNLVKTKLELFTPKTETQQLEGRLDFMVTRQEMKLIDKKLDRLHDDFAGIHDNLDIDLNILHSDLSGIRSSINNLQLESKKDIKYLIDKIDTINK